jgi:uncharacterized membrane protein YozB (DUF420 family)
MYKKFMKENITLLAIILFMCIYLFIQFNKPNFLFKKDGSIREFGIGYKNKTIFPVWLLSIVLAILCYLFLVYYVHYIC